MSNKKKLVICCGGTGGHFYPGLSVARAFKSSGGEVKIFLIGKHSHQQATIAENFGIESKILTMLPVPVGLMGKIKLLSVILGRIGEAKQYLIQEKPDFILGMGSFYSLPAILAAKKLGIPIYLHDGNSFVGKANSFLSRYARKIGLAFPPKNKERLKCRYVITGMPLRPELSPEKVYEQYGENLVDALNKEFKAEFSQDKPVVLVVGGSQGAASLNQVIPEAFAIMEREDLQIIHISGAGFKEEVSELYRKVQSPHLVIPNTENIGLLYAVASLVICRSGGSTISELALFGKYAFLVPYPYATDNHQRVNAEFYASGGNAQIINDHELIAELFAETLIDWLSNQEKLIKEAEKSRELSHPQAADEVIAMMME